MDDKRRLPRFRRRLGIRYRGESGTPRLAFSGDASVAGVFLNSSQVEAPGRTLELEADVPGEGLLRMRGEVVWARKVPPALVTVQRGGFGVRLLDPPEPWRRFFRGLEARRATSGD
jgi:hypothetical protein